METGARRPTSVLLPCALLLFAVTSRGSSQDCELPSVLTGGDVYEYAPIPDGPGGISFDTSGNLYVGNFNSDGEPNIAVHVFRVDPADSSVSTCGPMIDDPDVVFVDRAGVLTNPGDILVAGWQFPTNDGHITSLSSTCSSAEIVALGGCLGNTHVLAVDNSGRLYAAAATEWNICVYADGAWEEFLPPRPDFPDIAIDASDIYVSWDDIVHKYDTSGVLVDSLFTRGVARAIGPPGPFGGVIVSRPESLLAVDPVTKEETLLLVGPNSTGNVAFNEAGDLFLSQADCRRILHVTAGTASGVGEPPARGGPFLAQVRPNPLSREATVSFRAPEDGRVRFEILDLRGRRLAVLCDRHVPRGMQRLSLTLPDLAGGVYFLKGRSEWGTATTRLTVVR